MPQGTPAKECSAAWQRVARSRLGSLIPDIAFDYQGCRHFKRCTAAESRSERKVGLKGEIATRDHDSLRCVPGRHPEHIIRPRRFAVKGRKAIEREQDGFTWLQCAMEPDPAVRASRGFYAHIAVDRRRQNEPVLVVDVFANKIDPSWSYRGPLRRLPIQVSELHRSLFSVKDGRIGLRNPSYFRDMRKASRSASSCRERFASSAGGIRDTGAMFISWT